MIEKLNLVIGIISILPIILGGFIFLYPIVKSFCKKYRIFFKNPELRKFYKKFLKENIKGKEFIIFKKIIDLIDIPNAKQPVYGFFIKDCNTEKSIQIKDEDKKSFFKSIEKLRDLKLIQCVEKGISFEKYKII